MRLRILLSAFLFLVLGACGDSGIERDGQRLPIEAATVETAANKTVVLELEMAVADEERMIGLMYRRSMPETRGMMFVYASPQPLTFWMKNTYIPLDMMFVDAHGTIINIRRNTEPLSRNTYASTGPALVVIELNGGAAERLGIAPGDTVRHAVFDNLGTVH